MSSRLARGTAGYRAPELIENIIGGRSQPGVFSTKTDIWAFGCVLFSLATTGREEAFKTEYEVFEFKKGYGEHRVPQLSEEDITGLAGTQIIWYMGNESMILS